MFMSSYWLCSPQIRDSQKPPFEKWDPFKVVETEISISVSQFSPIFRLHTLALHDFWGAPTAIFNWGHVE